MRPLSRSILILALTLVFAGGGTVLAAQLAEPDDPVDVVTEEVAPPGDPNAGKAGDEPQFVEDRVLVGFERGATSGEQAAALEEVDADAVARVGRTTIAELPDGADVEEVAEELEADPDVAFAEPDRLRRLDGCAGCWQLGSAPGVNARSAHAAGATGEGSVVAVLDTGVADIPDLSGKVAGRRICRDDGTCGEDTTTAGSHGTVVASLIAARDDDQGITGAAPGATVKSWRIDQGGVITTSAVLAALGEVAQDPDVDVVSLSFSGPMASSAERQAIQLVLDAGKSVVGSAGNDGSYLPQYPAAYRGVISVGATDRGGDVATFSSYGKVDVVAPGVCVPASAPAGAGSSAGCPAPSDGVVYVSGTSFSTPLVSGVLALRRTPSALRNRLGVEGTAAAPATADAVLAKRAGHGRVDAGAWLASFAENADPYLVLEAADQLPHPGTTIDAHVLTSDGKLAEAPTALTVDGIATTTAPFEQVSEGVFRASLPTGNLPAGSLIVTATASAPAGRIPPPTTTTTLPPETTVAETTTTAPETTAPPDSTVDPTSSTDAETTTTASDTTAPPDTTVDPATTTEPQTTTEPAPTTTSTDQGAGGTASLATADDEVVTVKAAVPLRVLRPDDQAPGVALLGLGLDPGHRSDSLQGGGAGDQADDDLDDVFRVRLEAGDTIRLVLTPQAGKPIGVVLFSRGTTDVLGELDRIVAQSGAIAPDGTATLTYLAPVSGYYLVDVYTTGLESGVPGKGTYQLDTTITRPGTVTLNQAACSPNNDGLADVCRWTVLDEAATTVRSLVLTPGELVLKQAVGTGEHTWDGTDLLGTSQPDGGYLLRVLLTNAGGVIGHTLLFEQKLTLDRVRPSISDPDVAPDPFEPLPVDGDRDTTTFSVTSNERSFMRVYIYDATGSSQKTVIQSGYANAGRLRLTWAGTAGGATLPRGSYSYVIQVVDPAGNRTQSARAAFTID